MTNVTHTEISCGVDQIYGLTTPENFLQTVQRDAREEGRLQPFYIFSDASYRGRGDAIAAYIKANKLGSITKTRYKKNPNSGSLIKVYVWLTPTQTQLEAFMKEKKIKIVEHEDEDY